MAVIKRFGADALEATASRQKALSDARLGVKADAEDKPAAKTNRPTTKARAKKADKSE